MPLLVTCGSCQKKLNVRDELAGKSIKCPGCGAIIAAAAVAGGAAARPAPADEPPADEERRPRKKKKRRARRSSSEAQPLFMLGDIEMTPVKCLVFGGALLGVIGMIVSLFIFTPLGKIFSTESEAKFVDVYTAVNSIRYTDIGEYSLQMPGTTTYVIPGHRQIIISRDNPAGEFLMIHVKIPQKEIDARFQGVKSEFVLTRDDVEIDGDNGKLKAMFAHDRSDDATKGYHLAYIPPLRGGGQGLRASLSPRKQDWTHAGEFKEQADKLLEFNGQNGMNVKTEISEHRFDRAPAGSARGGSRAEGMVEAWLRVTWDAKSTAYIIADDHPQPNTISRTWDVTCFFPRPKNVGKEVTLYIFGKPRPVKVE